MAVDTRIQSIKATAYSDCKHKDTKCKRLLIATTSTETKMGERLADAYYKDKETNGEDWLTATTHNKKQSDQDWLIVALNTKRQKMKDWL